MAALTFRNLSNNFEMLQLMSVAKAQDYLEVTQEYKRL